MEEKNLNDLLSGLQNGEKLKRLLTLLKDTNNGGDGLFESIKPLTGHDKAGNSLSVEPLSEGEGDEKDQKIRLLVALKPYMSNHRREKIDLAVRYLQISKLSGLLKDYFK